MVLKAFESPETELKPKRPVDEQPRSAKWLPILVANTCWVIVGLLIFGFIWWAFGPVIAAISLMIVGSAFFSLIRWLDWLGKI
jgi:hypothetical protein